MLPLPRVVALTDRVIAHPYDNRFVFLAVGFLYLRVEG